MGLFFLKDISFKGDGHCHQLSPPQHVYFWRLFLELVDLHVTSCGKRRERGSSGRVREGPPSWVGERELGPSEGSGREAHSLGEGPCCYLLTWCAVFWPR